MKHQILQLTFIGIMVLSNTGHADDVNGAAKAFAQAQEVLLTGDAGRAADLFELADELAPSAPALRNAARARLGANHNAMAATHAAELLRRYPTDQESRTVAEAILSMLAPKLSALDITCSLPCKLQVDGKAASANAREQHSLFTQPGARTIVAVFTDERTTTKQITATVGGTLKRRFEPVAPLVQPSQPTPVVPVAAPIVTKHRGISRGWILASGIVTVGLGVTATLSGMQTLDTRDKVRDAVAAGDSAEAMDLYDTGKSQQLRTNILIGATAAVGVTTIILAFVTNWSGKSVTRELAVVPVDGGGSILYNARF